MTPQLFPLLLLLLLAGLPATRPAPPTCYSRMLALSREITSDFRSLQATEPSVSVLGPHLNEDGRPMQTQLSKICLWTGGWRGTGGGKRSFSFPVNVNFQGICALFPSY